MQTGKERAPERARARVCCLHALETDFCSVPLNVLTALLKHPIRVLQVCKEDDAAVELESERHCGMSWGTSLRRGVNLTAVASSVASSVINSWHTHPRPQGTARLLLCIGWMGALRLRRRLDRVDDSFFTAVNFVDLMGRKVSYDFTPPRFVVFWLCIAAVY